jgi:hypothetical protein
LPALYQYLYDLSEADGADQTLGTMLDRTRNGEPFGEIGLVIQQDPGNFWQAQTGAPDDPQPGNIPGGARDVLRSASFNNGDLTAFAADSGTWTAELGALKVEPEYLGGDAVSVFYVDKALPSYFEILATIYAEKPTAGYKSNAFLIFDYQSDTDFKFAGVSASLDKIQMGHRTPEGWVVDVQTPAQIRPRTAYYLTLALHGTTATLVVNGQDVFSHTFAPRVVNGYSYGLNSGMVGVGAENSIGYFDDVTVQVLPPEITLEYAEDFTDGIADLFTGGNTGSWSIGGTQYLGMPAAGVDRAVSLIDPGATLGLAAGEFSLAPSSVLELEATLNVDVAGGFVFDYVNENRFKFVALRADTDQVIIGHYTDTDGWVTDAAASHIINAGQSYDLDVSLRGTTVSVSVDGQIVTSHAFNGVTVDSGFGVLTISGGSAFDSVTMRTDDPAFRTDTPASLVSAEGLGSGAPSVAGTDLSAILDAALRRFPASAIIGDMSIAADDLPGAQLGDTRGRTIVLDTDAAGHGWFVDSTPDDDREFRGGGDALEAKPNGDAAGRIDMLTAVMHELGHIVGLDHVDSGLMADSLATGTRLLPEGMIGPAAVAGRVEEAARRAATDVRIFLEEQDALLRRDEARFLAWVETRHTGFVLDTADDEDDEDDVRAAARRCDGVDDRWQPR